MGMDGVSQTTHATHVKNIYSSTTDYKDVVLKDAHDKVRRHHKKEDGTLDLAVSFDGSWQKRGFTSRHGMAAVIEVETGLVIDYHVLATFCRVRNLLF